MLFSTGPWHAVPFKTLLRVLADAVEAKASENALALSAVLDPVGDTAVCFSCLGRQIFSGHFTYWR